jgi:hypothetical protein
MHIISKVMAVGLVLTGLGLVATPALATKGSDAIAQCNAKPGCQVKNGPNGTINIVTGDGHLIWCSDAGEGDCQVIYKKGPHDKPEVAHPTSNAVMH